jgi:hypothetical protein
MTLKYISIVAVLIAVKAVKMCHETVRGDNFCVTLYQNELREFCVGPLVVLLL